MTNRQFYVAMIKVQNIVRKGEFLRASELLTSTMEVIRNSDNSDLIAQLPALKFERDRLFHAAN